MFQSFTCVTAERTGLVGDVGVGREQDFSHFRRHALNLEKNANNVCVCKRDILYAVIAHGKYDLVKVTVKRNDSEL